MLERQFGEVSEWLKEHAWKVCIRQRIGGSTTGAASWTDDELARRLPEGRAQRVNPPLTAIFKLRACTEVRAFCLLCIPQTKGG
ncbi:hypothetical protein DK981_05915 [Salmonella enterica]|nr:hypothetical protein [Salmonella enterica]